MLAENSAAGTSKETGSKFLPVVRVASGNFLEAYDFQVFGYYATYIGRGGRWRFGLSGRNRPALGFLVDS